MHQGTTSTARKTSCKLFVWPDRGLVPAVPEPQFGAFDPPATFAGDDLAPILDRYPERPASDFSGRERAHVLNTAQHTSFMHHGAKRCPPLYVAKELNLVIAFHLLLTEFD